MITTVLTVDAHVHSEWSWDTGGPRSDARGRMVATCERALRIGLPGLIFTEHLDLDPRWRADPHDHPAQQQQYFSGDGYLRVPPLDVDGYFAAVEECRHRFGELTILTGIEFGQPHLNEPAARELVDLDRFDRINGSLHTLAFGDDRAEPNLLFRTRDADEVMADYLAEIPRLIAGSETIEVFCHIDYAIRYWPTAERGPFDPRRFEGGFRAAMRAVADSGRALEMNTRRLWGWMPAWWVDEGGRAVSFGSDAHEPDDLAGGFGEALAMLEAFGFRPGARPQDFWIR